MGTGVMAALGMNILARVPPRQVISTYCSGLEQTAAQGIVLHVAGLPVQVISRCLNGHGVTDAPGTKGRARVLPWQGVSTY